MKKPFITILCSVFFSTVSFGQADKHYSEMTVVMDSIAVNNPAYLKEVDVSVTDYSVSDLVRALAVSNGLNVNLALDGSRSRITCNLEHTPLKDVLLLCCRAGDLDLTYEDGIVTFSRYMTPAVEPVIIMERDSSGLYRMDFSNCPLDAVVRKVVTISGVNVLYSPDLSNRPVSGFGVGLDMSGMIGMITASNALRGTLDSNGIWHISEGGFGADDYSFIPSSEVGHSEPVYSVRLFPMRYRTTDNVVEVIPSRLAESVEIKVFPDLNSLILSGNKDDVEKLEDYLESIDKSVPLISIDVIIVDALDNKSRTTGISFGKDTEDTGASYGTFSPGVDISLGASGINRILNAFNGVGLVNLGNVGPDFYAGLKLLEEDGSVTLRSTPKLSTLNGHKAVLKSGEMKYYKESQVNIIGTQNPLQSESYVWKNVEASFILELTPAVSADSTITVRVELSQDEFTERDTDDLTAPPGMTRRSFNSIVKVRDGEMILLGGIEKNLDEDSSKGLPWVSRVPVLRLFFGNVTKARETRKLNVFISPRVVL